MGEESRESKKSERDREITITSAITTASITTTITTRTEKKTVSSLKYPYDVSFN